MSRTPTLSVVVISCNYEDYVGAAIDSALALDWPGVEVIVVDDGSTDRSREVIGRYGERVRAIFQENAGHLSACNRGFAASSGDIVIFLDCDDMLAPSLGRELAAAWTPGTSKLQVQMRVVDAAGRPTGTYFPQYRRAPAPAEIRAWALATTAYPTPCGSGNAYARWFLERIFPLPETCAHRSSPGRCAICSFSDSYCLAAAPLLGDVVTLPRPLVSYRVHGRNIGAMSALEPRKFAEEMTRALLRHAYARRLAASLGLAIAPQAIQRSLSFLSYRLASLRLAPATHPMKGDSVARILKDFWAAFLAPQGVALGQRLVLLAWAAAVALAPLALARKLVLWRFAPAARPRVLRGALARLAVVRA